MKFKFILPTLTEAESAFWRPIKYSLFPPLGLATLAAYLSPEDEAEIVDQHVQTLTPDDRPDVVAIQVYITNEPLWNWLIRFKQLGLMTPLLEGVLSKISKCRQGERDVPRNESARGSPVDGERLFLRADMREVLPQSLTCPQPGPRTEAR